MGDATARSQISARTVWTVGLNATALVGLLWLLLEIRTVVIWTVLALFFAVALQPLVAWFTTRGLRRSYGVALAFGMVAALLLVFALSVVPVVSGHWRVMLNSLPVMLDRLGEMDAVQWLDARFDVIERARHELRDETARLVSSVFSVVRTAMFGVGGAITISVLALFMHLFGPDLVDTILAWLRPDQRGQYAELGRRAMHSVGRYVLGTFFISSIGGAVALVTLWALGVPFFLPVAIATVLLGLVPFLGAWIAGLLVVLATLVTVGGQSALIALAVGMAYQQVENHLLQPLVQRRTMRMNPLIISLALLAGTSLLGIVGAVLALPVAGGIQVVLREVFLRRQQRLPSDKKKSEAEPLQPMLPNVIPLST